MKSMWRRPALWMCLTVGSAMGAYTIGMGAPPQEDRGEVILNESCTGCHTTRNVDIQALDQEGWAMLVNTMIEKGAKVKAEELPMFIEYLSDQHGPMPDGAGKKIVLNTCTVCHTLNRVKTHAASKADWVDTLNHMIGEGADITDADYPVLLDYLAKNFGELKQE